MVFRLAAIKLILSVATFAELGYLGTHNKRIAGVLLTFPILNGIGILTTSDPLAAANSIYVVVVFNGLLHVYRNLLLPDAPGASSGRVCACASWSPTWRPGRCSRVIGALGLVLWRDALPGPLPLLIGQRVLSAVATTVAWKPLPARPAVVLLGTKAFLSVWWSGAGFVRIGLFAFCCILLLAAANYYESKWVGMLSALPLPGLFAVATTLSTMANDEEFAIIRQTVLWGPPTVVAFNWIFAEAVARLLPTAPWLGLPLLVLLLGVDAALIFWAVPRLAAYLDGRDRKRAA